MTKENIQPLHAKLFAIMQNVDVVNKNSVNEHHKYKYASDAAYIHAVRSHLIQYRVMYHVEITGREQVVEGSKVHVLISGNLVFTCADSGEQLRIPYAGQGVDNGDKGLYKAITGMKKYGLNTTFMIATEDDPEAHEVTDKMNVSPETDAMIAKVEAVQTMEDYEALKPELSKYSIRLGQFEAEKLKKVCVQKIQSLKAT